MCGSSDSRNRSGNRSARTVTDMRGKQITLPDHLAVLVNNSALIEDLAVKAAIEGDPNLVFQAVLYDPLTSAVCSMDEILNMVQEMLDKNAEYLSYFKSLKINMEVLHEKENR